jgi:HEAT repeat protein
LKKKPIIVSVEVLSVEQILVFPFKQRKKVISGLMSKSREDISITQLSELLLKDSNISNKRNIAKFFAKDKNISYIPINQYRRILQFEEDRKVRNDIINAFAHVNGPDEIKESSKILVKIIQRDPDKNIRKNAKNIIEKLAEKINIKNSNELVINSFIEDLNNPNIPEFEKIEISEQLGVLGDYKTAFNIIKFKYKFAPKTPIIQEKLQEAIVKIAKASKFRSSNLLIADLCKNNIESSSVEDKLTIVGILSDIVVNESKAFELLAELCTNDSSKELRKEAFKGLVNSSNKEKIHYFEEAIKREADEIRELVLTLLVDNNLIPQTFRTLNRQFDREESPTFKAKIAIALGNYGHKKSLGSLIKGLKDLSPKIRAACALALGKMKSRKGISNVIKALYIEEDITAKAQMIKALGISGFENTISIINNYLSPENRPKIVIEAISGLVLFNEPTIVPTLHDYIKNNENSSVRSMSASALGSLGVFDPDETIEVLNKYLFLEKDENVKYEINRSLEKLKIKFEDKFERVSVISTILASENVEERINAIKESDFVQNPNVRDVLIQVLENETNPDIKSEIIKKFALEQDSFAEIASIRFLNDKEDIKVRLTCLDIIGFLHSKSAIEPIVAIINKDSAEIELKVKAIDILGLIGSYSISDTLIRHFTINPSVEVRTAILTAFKFINDKNLVPFIIESLRDDNSDDIRELSAVVLGNIGDVSELVDLLASAKFDESDRVKFQSQAAALTISSRNNVSDIDLVYYKYMADLDKRGSEIDRRGAMTGLGAIGGVNAINALKEHLSHDKDELARGYAAQSLGILGNPDSTTQILIDRLRQDESLLVKEYILTALGKLKDQKAVPVLISILQQESLPTRTSFFEALFYVLRNTGPSPQYIPYLARFLNNSYPIDIQKHSIAIIHLTRSPEALYVYLKTLNDDTLSVEVKELIFSSIKSLIQTDSPLIFEIFGKLLEISKYGFSEISPLAYNLVEYIRNNLPVSNESNQYWENIVDLTKGGIKERRLAALSLGSLDIVDGNEFLIERLKNDEDEIVRANSALSLGKLGDKQVFGTLFEIRQRETKTVVVSIERAIRDLENRHGLSESEVYLQKLKVDLDSDDESIRLSAIKDYVGIGIDDVEEKVLNLAFNDQNSTIRTLAFENLVLSKKQTVFDKIIPLLYKEKDDGVLESNLLELYNYTKIENYWNSFIELYQERTDKSVKKAIITLFSQFKSPEIRNQVSKHLITFIENEDESEIIGNIILTLSKIGSQEETQKIVQIGMKNQIYSEIVNDALDEFLEREIIKKDQLELNKAKIKLNSTDFDKKMGALEFFSENWDSQLISNFELLSKDSNLEIRKKVIEILIATSDIKSLPIIRNVAENDPEENIRMFTYNLLVDLPVSNEIHTVIKNGLKDSNSAVREVAVEVLANFSVETTFDLIDHYNNESNDIVRKKIVQVLSEESSDSILNCLILATHFDNSVVVREEAFISFQVVAKNRGYEWRDLELKLLDEKLYSSNTELKLKIIERIGNIGNLETVYSLFKLEKNNPELKTSINKALETLAIQLGYQDLNSLTRALFLTSLNSSNENTRREALFSLELESLRLEEKDTIIIALEEYLRVEPIINLKIKAAKLLADLESQSSINVLLEFALNQKEIKIRKGITALSVSISVENTVSHLYKLLVDNERLGDFEEIIIEALGWVQTVDAVEALTSYLNLTDNNHIIKLVINTLTGMKSSLAVPALRRISTNPDLSDSIKKLSFSSLDYLTKELMFRNLEEMYASLGLSLFDGNELKENGIKTIVKRLKISNQLILNLIKNLNLIRVKINSETTAVDDLWSLLDKVTSFENQLLKRKHAIEIHIANGLNVFIEESKKEKGEVFTLQNELDSNRKKAQATVQELKLTVASKQQKHKWESNEEQVLFAINYLEKKYGTKKISYESIREQLLRNNIKLDYTIVDDIVANLIMKNQIEGKVDTKETSVLDDDVLVLEPETKPDISTSDIRFISLIKETITKETRTMKDDIRVIKEKADDILSKSDEILYLNKEILGKLEDSEANLRETSLVLEDLIHNQFEEFVKINELQQEKLKSDSETNLTIINEELGKLTLKYEQGLETIQNRIEEINGETKRYFDMLYPILPVPTKIESAKRKISTSIRIEFSCAKEPEDILTVVEDCMIGKWFKLSFLSLKTIGKLFTSNWSNLSDDMKSIWNKFKGVNSADELDIKFLTVHEADQKPDAYNYPILTASERDQMILRLRETGFYERAIFCSNCRSWVCRNQHWNEGNKICIDCQITTARRLTSRQKFPKAYTS